MTDKTLGAYTRHEKHDTAHDIDWQAVAEEHEDTIRALIKERDEARATKDMHKRRADEERARADAAESRPLTPDAITDEAMRRAVKAWEETGELRPAIFAAITTPARPEGAEDVAVRLFQAGAAVGVEMTEEQRDELADHLAAMHVRVVGEEQP